MKKLRVLQGNHVAEFRVILYNCIWEYGRVSTLVKCSFLIVPHHVFRIDSITKNFNENITKSITKIRILQGKHLVKFILSTILKRILIRMLTHNMFEEVDRPG